MQAAMLQPLRAHSLAGAASPRGVAGRHVGVGRAYVAGKGLVAGNAGRAGQQRCRRGQPLAALHWFDDPATETLTAERSTLINKEVVLFLFQLEMDSQLQRALTYEQFDMAQEVRARREQVDAALRELQQIKGPGCGARVAGNSDTMQFAPQIMTLKAQMQAAVESEQYAEAAALRDRLREVEAQAAEAADLAAQYLCPVEEPRFCLGDMVVHSSKGYRGVVCGWDLTCCEQAEWQAAAGVSELANGPNQVFYHVLVDTRDWPADGDQPPVAYVAEECLTAGSSADFANDQPLVDNSFEHPYSYLLFLGADGQGNMVPARQLRDKYCVDRRDVYAPGESRWEEEEDEEEEEDGEEEGGSGGSGPQGGGGPQGDAPWGGSGGGSFKIPGIDMSSLQ